MKKCVIILFFLMAVQARTQVRVEWPAISMQTKPWARWWWPGSAVNKADIFSLLKQYKQAGLGGLEITPVYGVKGQEDRFINYLSRDWMDVFEFTLMKAGSLQLGIDMATGTGWPFGGPWVGPDDACRNFHMKVFSLKEGERITEPVKMMQEPFVSSIGVRGVNADSLKFPIGNNPDLQKYAFEQVRYATSMPLQTLVGFADSGETRELTSYIDKEGILQWTAPKGTWKIYALFMGWHGKMVERAAPGGEGDVIDHFSTRAFKNYVLKFDTAFKGRNIQHLRSFFNDSYEVDDAKGQSNWTPDFFSEFQKRRGYDLKTQLPSLYAALNGTVESAVLYDYRLTVSELLYDNFTAAWRNWAKTKGKIIRNQAHGSPANILDLYAAADIPETEGNDILRFKFASSAAHVGGKKLVSAEASTWLGEHFCSKLSDIKANADQFFLAGVNHLFYHGVSYSPPAAKWPGWLFYASVHFAPANPFWKDFAKLNEYVSRCQSFLQRGNPDNDILLYYPFSDFLSAKGSGLLRHFDGMQGVESSGFAQTAKEMQEAGYSFDFISDKQIMDLNTEKGEIRTGSLAYKTIVLPGCSFIPLATWQKLLRLAEEGATVIFYKKMPAEVPGPFNGRRQTETLQLELSALHFIKTTGQEISKAITGQGSVLAGDNLRKLFSYAGIERELLTDSGIAFTRKEIDGDKEYFIVNNNNQEWNGWLPFLSAGNSAVLFDPMMHKSGLSKFKKDNGRYVKVFVQLKPGESCFVRILKGEVKAENYPYILDEESPGKIQGQWEVTFLNGGPSIPGRLTLQQPGYWTDQKDSAYTVFSGTASYSVKFDHLPGKSQWYQLDLGKVSGTARVYLNGKNIDVLIGPFYKVLIKGSLLRNKNNLLRVDISNSMINRIIDLDRKGADWKIFYNINFPAFYPANRGKDGLFNAGKWETEEAGLKGPVLLSPVTVY